MNILGTQKCSASFKDHIYPDKIVTIIINTPAMICALFFDNDNFLAQAVQAR